MKFYSKLQNKLISLITFKRVENEWTFIVGCIILAIILLFSFSLYFYEEAFLKTNGFFRRLSFGIVLGFLILGFIYITVLINTFKRANKMLQKTSEVKRKESDIVLKEDILNQNNFIEEGLFDKKTKELIIKVIEEMNLSDSNDFIILFSFIQKFIFKNKVSNSKLLKEIPNVFGVEMPTASYYSQMTNNLYIWKDNNAKIKEVKEVYNLSPYYERFEDIKNKYYTLK